MMVIIGASGKMIYRFSFAVGNFRNFQGFHRHFSISFAIPLYA